MGSNTYLDNSIAIKVAKRKLTILLDFYENDCR